MTDRLTADPRVHVALTLLRLNARLFRHCVDGVSDAESLARPDARTNHLALDARASMRYPVDDPTVLGALAFLLQHESYHVGQMALLRKHATGRPMKY